MITYGTKSHVIARGCGYSAECDQPRKGYSNQYITVQISTGCCTGDSCTPTVPTVPPSNPEINGLRCPSCFSITSDQCDPMNNTECKGTENKCISYTLSNTGGQKTAMAIYGCTTENLCSNFNGNITSTVAGTEKISIACTNATVIPNIGTSSSSPTSIEHNGTVSTKVVTASGPAITKENSNKTGGTDTSSSKNSPIIHGKFSTKTPPGRKSTSGCVSLSCSLPAMVIITLPLVYYFR
ncbi:hypothetical protein FKM82_012994 [Ascaphus truei]